MKGAQRVEPSVTAHSAGRGNGTMRHPTPPSQLNSAAAWVCVMTTGIAGRKERIKELFIFAKRLDEPPKGQKPKWGLIRDVLEEEAEIRWAITDKLARDYAAVVIWGLKLEIESPAAFKKFEHTYDLDPDPNL